MQCMSSTLQSLSLTDYKMHSELFFKGDFSTKSAVHSMIKADTLILTLILSMQFFEGLTQVLIQVKVLCTYFALHNDNTGLYHWEFCNTYVVSMYVHIVLMQLLVYNIHTYLALCTSSMYLGNLFGLSKTVSPA